MYTYKHIFNHLYVYICVPAPYSLHVQPGVGPSSRKSLVKNPPLGRIAGNVAGVLQSWGYLLGNLYMFDIYIYIWEISTIVSNDPLDTQNDFIRHSKCLIFL